MCVALTLELSEQPSVIVLRVLASHFACIIACSQPAVLMCREIRKALQGKCWRSVGY